MDPQTGPGRFALGSEFEIVKRFFDDRVSLTNSFNSGALDQYIQPGDTVARLSKKELAGIYGLEYYGLTVVQHSVSDGYDDLTERTFVWNNTLFQLTDSSEFVITGTGEVYIENFAVEPRRENDHTTGLTYQPDNFDFISTPGLFMQQANAALEHGIDPSRIGRQVELRLDSSYVPQLRTYDLDSYLADQQTASGWSQPTYSQIVLEMDPIVQELFASGVTATIHLGKAVIYGSDAADIISGTVTRANYDIREPDSIVSPWGTIKYYLDDFAHDGVIVFSGAGGDYVLGTHKDDWIYAGVGNDVVEANGGNDLISGGQDADVLDGGSGIDFLIYDGASGAVDLDFLSGTGIGGHADGDTFTNIEGAIGTDGHDKFIAEAGDLRLAGGAGGDTLTIKAPSRRAIRVRADHFLGRR